MRARSILQLTVTGFLTVTVLLIVALVITARELDGLSEQSRLIISQSAQAMTAGRSLIQQAAAMERNARQYNIVGDSEILNVYANRRKTFAAAAQQLSSLELSQDMTGLLHSLVRNEALAYNGLTSGASAEADNPLYPHLLEISYRISDLVEQWTAVQLAALREEAGETRALLTLQALLLISSALLLAGVFTALITRPLYEIEKAINQLGGGQYAKPIRIHGPRDLISLGGRLDWLRSRLGKLEQQRSSFLRHVSHEFKTPLAAMQESAALLKEGVVGPISPQQKEILEIQSHNCQRLQALIDDLLRYHSDSFSVLATMPRPLRLDRVIEEVVAAHELLLRSQRLRVERRLGRLIVEGDREQLRVVIDNLFTNAIKYSPEGGRIELALQRDRGDILFIIQDEGPGIDPEERERVFDAFYQGRSSGKPFFNGSGLGLAIVQEYVKANGGQVAAADSPRGARFELRFPAPEAA